ncbi:metallophosphoesterase [Salinarimonas soli]|uniref:Metallophosphoesterase n=1 Tax=Salinarimonas soli TaxID=1638099 RepID=A0A5B2VE51_9HYPH|nr:metallophosphoesterase [Salinarimonas soli]KAA2236710.1 metallophosphoesterase [Salinarimonas soli]
MVSRRGLLAGAAGSAILGAGLGAYGLVVEPRLRLRVQAYALSPAGWPGGVRLRIAALADIHAGLPYMPLARVRQIVEATNALAPDLVVLLGDYASSDRFPFTRIPWDETVPLFRGLDAPLGVYGILGNHEFWDDPSAQRRRGDTLAHDAFRRSRVPLLENDAVRLQARGGPVWLLGLGDQLAFRLGRARYIGRDDLPGTLAKVTDDAPAILLAHEPDIFPKVPGRIALTLAGHTHGGQVRLFGHSPVVPSHYGNRYAYGHVVEDGRHLIVSGGLGTVAAGLVPVRFGVPPEIVVVDIWGE